MYRTSSVDEIVDILKTRYNIIRSKRLISIGRLDTDGPSVYLIPCLSHITAAPGISPSIVEHEIYRRLVVKTM